RGLDHVLPRGLLPGAGQKSHDGSGDDNEPEPRGHAGGRVGGAPVGQPHVSAMMYDGRPRDWRKSRATYRPITPRPIICTPASRTTSEPTINVCVPCENAATSRPAPPPSMSSTPSGPQMSSGNTLNDVSPDRTVRHGFGL